MTIQTATARALRTTVLLTVAATFFGCHSLPGEDCWGAQCPSESGGAGSGGNSGVAGSSIAGGASGSSPHNWRPFGANQPGGLVTEVAFDPREPNVVYVSAGRNFYRSSDSGTHFEEVATLDATINVFGFPKSSPGMLLAGSTLGVIESKDYGTTWKPKSLDGVDISRILVHPADSRIVLAAVNGVGMLRSTDGGETWLAGDQGLPNGTFTSLVGDPLDSQRLLVNVESFEPSGATPTSSTLESLDSGSSWYTVLPPDVGWAVGIVACPADFNVMVAGSGPNLSISRDAGATWQALSVRDSIVTDMFAFAGADCNTLYVSDLLSMHSSTLHRSTDGGNTFVAASMVGTETLHSPYAYRLAIDPRDPQHLFATMAAGLFQSRDGAETWMHMPNIGVPQVRQLMVAGQSEEIWATTWAAGLWRWSRGSNNWTHMPTPNDATDSLLSLAQAPNDPNHVLVGGWNSTLLTRDGGGSFTVENEDDTPYAIAFSPNDPASAWFATDWNGVMRSESAGAGHATPFNQGLTKFANDVPFFAGGYFMRTIAFDASGGAYLGGEKRGAFHLQNGATAWTAVSSELASSSVRCFLNMPGAMYACTSDRGVARIDLTTRQVAFLSKGLMNLDVTGLVANGSSVFATTSHGVYKLLEPDEWILVDPVGLPGMATSSPLIYQHADTTRLIVRVDDFGLYALDL